MLISRVWANRVTLQVLFRYSWLLTVMFYDKMILSKSYFHRVFLCGWKTKSLLENISKNLYTHSPFLKSGWKFWLSYEEKEVQLNSFVLRGEQFVVLVVLFVIVICPILCNPMDYSMPVSPVLHYLLEFAQIHVLWINDAIQPSHPLLPPSPPALRLSLNQGLFQWVDSFHRGQSIGASASTSALPVNSQGRFPLGLTGLMSLLSTELLRVFSSMGNNT